MARCQSRRIRGVGLRRLDHLLRRVVRLAGIRQLFVAELEYQSIYYFTRYINPHSYIGIQPPGPGEGSHTATRRSASITLRCGPVAAKRSTAFTVNSWSDAMFP